MRVIPCFGENLLLSCICNTTKSGSIRHGQKLYRNSIFIIRLGSLFPSHRSICWSSLVQVYFTLQHLCLWQASVTPETDGPGLPKYYDFNQRFRITSHIRKVITNRLLYKNVKPFFRCAKQGFFKHSNQFNDQILLLRIPFQ